MKSIEKSLKNFLDGTTPRMSEDIFIDYASKSRDKANEIIDILFNVINDSLDGYTGNKSLEKERDLLIYISSVMLNCDEVDRGIVSRNIRKLDYKLEHLTEANKYRIIDFEKADIEIEKTRLALDAVSEQTVTKDTRQYDIINHLVNVIKDTAVIEKVLRKESSLVNAKDKEENCLFQNMIIKYMNSVSSGNEEDAYYYSNILSLIMSQKDFRLLDKDKKECLKIIYASIQKMGCVKKKRKENIVHIDFLNSLVDGIKGEEKEMKIDDLAKKHGISIYFDSDIISQVNSIKTKSGTMTDRVVVDDYTITIDKEGAIEIDDALTCRKLPNGNYLLGVHIASVLGYFPYESDVVQEALSRTRSIYLPKDYQSTDDDYNRVIPIFPYRFSADVGSLVPGESRLARSYFFEIDNNANIVREEFRKSIVKSDLKASYGQIDQVILNGSKNKELERLVNCLYEVTNILDKKYVASDIYEKVKNSSDDFSELPVKNIGSQKIINKAMMLTGVRVAEFCARNNYPCVYRVQAVDAGQIVMLQAMIDSLGKSSGKQFEQLIGTLKDFCPKGWYGIEGSHYGMGVPHYGHFTSELRRAPDILNEHVLEVCYDREPTDEDIVRLQHEIDMQVKRFNTKEDSIDRFITDYKNNAYQKRRR